MINLERKLFVVDTWQEAVQLALWWRGFIFSTKCRVWRSQPGTWEVWEIEPQAEK